MAIPIPRLGHALRGVQLFECSSISSSIMSKKSKALELKNKGNELFVGKEYTAANEIYTQAISQDENNAVLYANRAACALALQK
jgi:hypothetical protein